MRKFIRFFPSYENFSGCEGSLTSVHKTGKHQLNRCSSTALALILQLLKIQKGIVAIAFSFEDSRMVTSTLQFAVVYVKFFSRCKNFLLGN